LASLSLIVVIGLAGGTPATATDVHLSALQTVGMALAVDDSVDPDIHDAAKGFTRELRRYWRTLGWLFAKVTNWWGLWFKRAAFSLGVAIISVIADGGLMNVWRTEGLRALTTYVPLMLYVYGRLLFSRGVSLAPKLLLVAAIVYGVVREDFLPDRRLLRGRLEDILFIFVAARLFVYACPQPLIDVFATRAVRWRQRVSALQQRAR
jgi:uncharacterized membrane protein YkvA (DUF1232 family)